MKNNKRILITECSGECRNFRVVTKDSFFDDCDLEEGCYCAAYLHGPWQKIDPKECENCTREKYLTGLTKAEVVDIIAKAMEPRLYVHNQNVLYLLAEDVLNAVLEGKK